MNASSPRQISISFELTPDDQAAFRKGVFAGRRPRRALARSVILILFGAVLVSAFGRAPLPFVVALACFALGLVLLASVATVYLISLYFRWTFELKRRRPGAVAPRSFAYTFGSEGVGLELDGRQGLIPWTEVQDITDTPEFFQLWPDRRRYYLIPKRAFAEGEEDIFRQLAESGTGIR